MTTMSAKLEEPAELHSKRCVLRPWRDDDLEAFARLNADPRVMEHFPSTLSRSESDAFARRIRDHIDTKRFGFWAVEVPGVAPFIGFVGLATVMFEAPFTPCVETGWRLDPAFWNKGYAREAASASLTFAFETLRLPEVVSFTTAANTRSTAVMEAIGMKRDLQGDFDHPRLAAVNYPSRCVLYRASRPKRSGAEETNVEARARAFAAALDADDFEIVRPLLSVDCQYDVRGSALRGANAILRSYAEAARYARATFDDVRYESEVSSTEAEATVRFADILSRAGREHRHRCVQHLTFDAEGRIARIAHEDLPGEREAVAAFIAATSA